MLVDKKQLAEILCDDGPAFDAMQDLLMAMAEDNTDAEMAAAHELALLAKAKYYELSGQADEDDAQAQRDHDDFVSSVNHAAG